LFDLNYSLKENDEELPIPTLFTCLLKTDLENNKFLINVPETVLVDE